MDAPGGTLVFARPGVKRTAIADERYGEVADRGRELLEAYRQHAGMFYNDPIREEPRFKELISR